jgi:hypothetical protein
MHRYSFAVLLALVLPLSACGEADPHELNRMLELQVHDFKNLVRLHLNNVNHDAQMRGGSDIALKVARYHEDPSQSGVTGTVVSTFVYESVGLILYDVECPICETKHTFPYTGSEVFCPRCGGSTLPKAPKEELADWINEWESMVAATKPGEEEQKKFMEHIRKRRLKAHRMFEIIEDNEHPEAKEVNPNPEEPIKATVRYIRYVLTYDPNAVVEVPTKILAQKGIDGYHLPSWPGEGEGEQVEPSKWTPSQLQQAPPGFYRAAEVYIGEAVFEYWSGRIEMKGQPKETWIRPWKTLRPQKSK